MICKCHCCVEDPVEVEPSLCGCKASCGHCKQRKRRRLADLEEKKTTPVFEYVNTSKWSIFYLLISICSTIPTSNKVDFIADKHSVLTTGMQVVSQQSTTNNSETITDEQQPEELEKKQRAKRRPKTAAQVALNTEITKMSGVFQFATPTFAEEDIAGMSHEELKNKQIPGICMDLY